jgi:hypothetical protein
VTDARSVPHVRAANEEVVVAVGGELARDDVLRAAGSLR